VHDGPQHGVQVAQPGQVAGGVEEPGQLVLPAAAPLQQGAYPQRDQLDLLQLGQLGRGGAAGAGGQHRALELDRGSLPGEQFQVLDRGGHAGHCRLPVDLAARGQWAVHPPSRGMEAPVMKSAAGVQR
jgi:hypothetical protein